MHPYAHAHVTGDAVHRGTAGTFHPPPYCGLFFFFLYYPDLLDLSSLATDVTPTSLTILKVSFSSARRRLASCPFRRVW